MRERGGEGQDQGDDDRDETLHGTTSGRWDER
jgi:hypothetical protein